MDKRYLFVAEADKIQDLLFCSSKLREVAGGSVMLTEFCEELVPQLINEFNGKEIISAGGSFRILFNSKEKAEEFGDYLSELYRRVIGGTITVAEPVEVTSEKDAIEKAQVNLRKAKHQGKIPVSTEQIPYTAICASCGIGIARYFIKESDEKKERYLCEVCKRKSEARKRIREKFLKKFAEYIGNGKKIADDKKIAGINAKNYVAYIVADVNNMGTVFSSCNSFNELKNLSSSLNDVIQKSLAEPVKLLMKNLKESFPERDDIDSIPVLPLILAGDDVFAIIPAKWALDFTHRFCNDFEIRIKDYLKKIGIVNDISPTISSSVIICKGKFPYLIAHNIGEELLNKAKKKAKKENKSTISFNVLAGSEIVRKSEEEKKFVASYPAYTVEELEKLIEYRLKLKNLPGTRRIQLETIFYKAEMLKGSTAFSRMISEWVPERDSIIKRIEKPLRDNIIDALKNLGNSKEDHNWVECKGKYYHKLPDLLISWDFAYDLDKKPLMYEGEMK